MCLSNQTYPKYQGNIRWKFLEFDGNYFNSPAHFSYIWNEYNETTINVNSYNYSQQGFHVFLNKNTAINAVKYWTTNFEYLIVKLECEDFIAGGIISRCDDYSDGKRGERWEKAKVLAIYDTKGKDVTKKYWKYLK